MMKTISSLLLLGIVFISSCHKEDPIVPSVAQFTTASVQAAEYGGAKNIEIKFSTPTKADVDLLVAIADSTAHYGEDFKTVPDGSFGFITLAVPKGSTSASFTVMPTENLEFKAKRVAKFTLAGNSANINWGDTKTVRLNLVDDDLVCYLPMKGSAIDVSYYANTSYINGATLTTGRESTPNTGYYLDGISNYIKIANSPVLDTIKNQITLAAWINPSSFSGGNFAIIEKAYSSHVNPYYQYKLGLTGDMSLNIPGSFLFTLSINNTYKPLISAAGTWSPYDWYFVVGTYDGKNMTLYVNGAQVATQSATGKIDSFGTDVYLGKVNNHGNYTDGIFGEVRIYNRALSATEVSSLYFK